MRRKYFLRGFGLGVILTVLTFSLVLLLRGNTMSDEQIMREAMRLGMIMPDAQEEESGDADTSAEDEDAPAEGETKVETLSGDDVEPAPRETTDPTTEAAGSGTRAAAADEDAEESQTETPADGEVIDFTVRAGESSAIVGANLYEAGLVDDPTAFNEYLESNHYDSRIHAGDFEIRTGSSYKVIADTITN